jgi:hypothetical protein
MNYLNIYNDLCNVGKIDRNLEYFEKHHILPRCLGGTNDKNNLTKLTYREHYIAHWLLIKLYPNEPKIHYSFLCMLRNPHGYRILTSKMFDTIKKNFSEFKRWHCKINNPGRTEKSKTKARNRMLSNENPMIKTPEKNHTVKRTVVYYQDGTIKEFKMKKDFMETLMGLTHMQKRYKIEKNDLKEFGVVRIERFGK